MQEIIQTYDDALDFIYSKLNFSLSRQQSYSPDVFNLDRMHAFLEAIGTPQKKFASIHVAGTKGKGSICAMIASVLKTAGYKTGFYSSPHLIDFTERIKVSGVQIDQAVLVSTLNAMLPVITSMSRLTTFEIITAIAFKYFEVQQIDIGVIEVGLGGRLDATNTIQPDLSIISRISLDHMHILGDTLEKIAAEKAGIIKAGIPVVISNQPREALQIFETISKSIGSQLLKTEEMAEINLIKENITGQTFDIFEKMQDEAPISTRIELPLLGAHQRENAATAFIALRYLQNHGWEISDEDITNGFQDVFWPGRFEILSEKPTLIIDAAHNEESARRLVETIRQLFPEKKVTIVFGASEDKNIAGMLTHLETIADRIIFSKSIHPRAADPEDLQKTLPNLSCDTIVMQDIQEAYQIIQTTDQDSIILATGSIFIAAAIRELWVQSTKRE